MVSIAIAAGARNDQGTYVQFISSISSGNGIQWVAKASANVLSMCTSRKINDIARIRMVLAVAKRNPAL
jgi:hypothetical protein